MSRRLRDSPETTLLRWTLPPEIKRRALEVEDPLKKTGWMMLRMMVLALALFGMLWAFHRLYLAPAHGEPSGPQSAFPVKGTLTVFAGFFVLLGGTAAFDAWCRRGLPWYAAITREGIIAHGAERETKAPWRSIKGYAIREWAGGLGLKELVLCLKSGEIARVVISEPDMEEVLAHILNEKTGAPPLSAEGLAMWIVPPRAFALLFAWALLPVPILGCAIAVMEGLDHYTSTLLLSLVLAGPGVWGCLRIFGWRGFGKANVRLLAFTLNMLCAVLMLPCALVVGFLTGKFS